MQPSQGWGSCQLGSQRPSQGVAPAWMQRSREERSRTRNPVMALFLRHQQRQLASNSPRRSTQDPGELAWQH